MKALPFNVGKLLERAIARVRRIYLLRGLALVGIVWLLGTAAVMGVDSHLVIFDDRIRWAMTAGVGLLAVVTAVFALWRPLRRKLDFRRIALLLDERHPEQEERLSTLVELSESDAAKSGFSQALLGLVGALASDAAGRIDLGAEFPFRRALRWLAVLAAMALAMSAAIAVSPRLVGRLFLRAVAPWADVGNLHSTAIKVVPGDLVALSGSIVRIEASNAGASAGDGRFSIRISRRRGLGWTEETAEPMAGGVYETTADLGERSWRYRIHSGNAVTRYYYVRVSQMPKWESFHATVTYPAYTHLKPFVVSNQEVGAIKAIEGSRVKFDLKVSDPGTVAEFRIAGEQVFEHTMVSNRTAEWTLDLVNEDGFRAEKGRHPLTSFIDQAPTVVIEKPTGTLRLPQHAKIPVEITATDDIGISEAYLRVSVDGGPWSRLRSARVPLVRSPTLGAQQASPTPPFVRTATEVDLSRLDLIVAKDVRFDVVVSDACPPELGGRHSATSMPFAVRFAANEASYEIQELKEQVDDARRDIAEAGKRLADARTLARQVRDELRRDQKASAATEEKGERLAHELDEAEKRIAELRDLFLSDERFAPLARPLDRLLNETLKPALEEVENAQFRDHNERADAVDAVIPEMEKASRELDDFSRRLAERAERVDAFEKVKDLAVRQDALAKAVEELTRERPLDTAKLEAWKRLEEAAMRKAEELSRQDPASDLSEARRKMESAVREIDRLKKEVEAEAAESNRLAKAATDEAKAFRARQLRQAQELAGAVADQQRALEALSKTNLAAAAQVQQSARDRLKKAEALPAVKALQELANEAARLEGEGEPCAQDEKPRAQEFQQAAAEAARAEQALREALASPTNAVERQALENLDRELRAELPKRRAALDAARAAREQAARDARLDKAAAEQRRALEALEKGDVTATEAAQRRAEEHLKAGAATPSVKAMQRMADAAARKAEGTSKDSEAMENARAEQRVAAKALAEEQAIREAIARGEKTQDDLDDFDKAFREQIGEKERTQNAESAVKPASAPTKPDEMTEGTKALQDAAAKAETAAANSQKLRPDLAQAEADGQQPLPTVRNAREARKAAADAQEEERQLREAMAKGEASSADLDALDRAHRRAAEEAAEKLEKALEADKRADLGQAAAAQQKAQEALEAAKNGAPQAANGAASAQKQAEDLLKRGEATEGAKAMQQLAGKAAAAAQKMPRDAARARRAADLQKAAAEALDRERDLREQMAAGEKTPADLEAHDRATLAEAAEQSAAFDRAEAEAAEADRQNARRAAERNQDLAQAIGDQQRALGAIRQAAAKRAEEARARAAGNQAAAEARAREAKAFERQAAEAQSAAEDRLERSEATDGVKALQQQATTAARNAGRAPQTKEKFDLAAAAQKAAAEALQNELEIRKGMEKGTRSEDELAALDDQLRSGLLQLARERTQAAQAAAQAAIQKAKDVLGTEEDDSLGQLADAALEAARDAVSSRLSESKLRNDDALADLLRGDEDAIDAIMEEAAEEQSVEDGIRGLQQSAAEALARNDRARAANLQREIARAQARAADAVNGEDETAARAAANEAQARASEAFERANSAWNDATKAEAQAAQRAAVEKEQAAQEEARSVRNLSKLAAAEKAAARGAPHGQSGSAASPASDPSERPQGDPSSEAGAASPASDPSGRPRGKPSAAAEAAQDGSDAMDREVNAQAAALGMSKRGSSQSARGKGKGRSKGKGGGVSEEMKALANDLKRKDSPDFFKSIFARLGWFKIRGLSKDGVTDRDLKDVPREYRDLVRRYFLKLAEENPERER